MISKTFVELPKFTKTVEELETIEEKWYYFLKHADESNQIEQKLSDTPEIKETYDVIERANWSEKDFFEYERAAMAIADAKGAIIAAKEEGREEGREDGREEIIKRMLHQNIDSETISQMTGCSINYIKNISLKQ